MTPFPTNLIPPALQLAQQSLAQNQLRQAEILYRQVLAVDPENAQATHGLGLVAMRVNRAEAAVELFTKSVAMNATEPAAHLDLGNALLALGRLEPAIEAYRRAILLNPGFAGAYSNLGIALHQVGRIQECLQAFQKAAELSGELPEAHNNLANVLRLFGRNTEAISEFHRAISLRPDSAETINNLAGALFDGGRIEEAISTCRQALKLRPAAAAIHSNLAWFLAFDPKCDARTVFEEHRRWNELHARPMARANRSYRNDRSPDRRLKIGYVSPDLREHPIAYFIEGLLVSHDPVQIETFCYAGLQARPDQASERLQRLTHHWRNITGLSDQRVAEMIEEDHIDILVDLAGHTAGNRLLVFARKPAPIQVTYLGYPNTTGLDTIDYRLTDGWADPPGSAESFHSEELVCLPRTFAIYQPPGDVGAEVSPPPVLLNGYVTFGSFNRLSKVNDTVVACWAELLKQVESTRLLMMTRGLEDAATVNRLQQAFECHGVDPRRMDLLGAQSRAEYFSAHGKIDVLLDPFPVNGHTITCHALWMGVPVITLAGKTHAGRLGTSVLHNLGMEDFIAETPADYVRLAAGLAGTPQRLAELRSTLRARMSSSPIMDFVRFARNVEEAYRSMWRRWSGADTLGT